MARVVAGIGSSHVPSIGRAYDRGLQRTGAWRPLFDAYRPVRRWLSEEIRPDLAVVVYNDHGNAFFFDRYPTFALGVAESYPPADEGFGPRALPPVPGDLEFSWHMAQSLVADEFDLMFCQDLPVDHGLLVPLPLLWSHQPSWDIRVVPLAVNVLLHPLPTARRCYRLGAALRRAVERYPENRRVVVVGTGGLSHQLQGKRFGHLAPDFDHEWLDRLVADPEGLAALSHEEIMAKAGAEAVEIIMWLIMRGALSAEVKEIYRNYYAPMTTGMALLGLADTSRA
jgi:protocatechuate 4,5-dioxygenase, beta chain